MNSYKVKGIILVVIISLASIMMPFSVYADTIDSHIRGRNYTYEPITYNEIQVSTNTYYENIGVFHITFELDDEYIGYVLPNYSIQYDNYFYGASTPNWGTLIKTFDRRIFVNGSSFSFDVSINWNSTSINSAPGGDPFNYDSYTITSSDVTKYADIDSLDQIINILQDNQDIITDIYGELQSVVTNTSLANTYLETLTQLKQWHVPFESFSYVYSLLNKYPNKVINTQNIYYFDYPVFNLNNGDEVINYTLNTSNQYLELILGINKNISSSTTFKNFFTSSEEYYVNDFTSLNISYGNSTVDSYIRIIKLKISTNGSSSRSFQLFVNSDTKIIPIYLKRSNQTLNVSTDFALIFGLSNQLLDDLHIIAQGTNQSNSAASDLENEASEYSDIADDVIGVEEGLTSNFETEVNKIDLNTGLNVFGGNFMTSATWVRTQFDRLTENTPYGSLVVYGLTLGFAMLMLGKVFL